jgi:hypothetical protein
MDALDLEPSPFEFHTASGETLEGVGQFHATLQLGPVVLKNFVMIADVLGDRLLGMDFLSATDTWVGLQDGHLHIKQEREEVTMSWPLQSEDQAARYIATRVYSVTKEPMSQALVPWTVVGLSREDMDRPTGIVMAEPIGSLTPDMRVPVTLV